uniref:LIM zinc-binding domain-containing protein n=1 Tax=Acrobeloides nanus TaxID=290746 RepID=A0A914C2Z5_9BILA
MNTLLLQNALQRLHVQRRIEMFGDTQQRARPKCGFCGEEVEKKDEMVIERKPIHKNCFKCGACGDECKIGHSLSVVVGKYGWFFFCGKHKLLSPGEREEALQKRGFQPKAKK